MSEILDGCEKTSDQAACVEECSEHEEAGEFDQVGLDCAQAAGTCEAWALCGDFL